MKTIEEIISEEEAKKKKPYVAPHMEIISREELDDFIQVPPGLSAEEVNALIDDKELKSKNK